YHHLLELLSKTRDERILNALLFGIQESERLPKTDAEAKNLVQKLKAFINKNVQLEWNLENDREREGKRLILRSWPSGVPKTTVLDSAFLNSPEYRELLEAHQKIKRIQKPPYYLKVLTKADGEEGHLTPKEVQSVSELVTEVMERARKGQMIQRYKGLGEMN